MGCHRQYFSRVPNSNILILQTPRVVMRARRFLI